MAVIEKSVEKNLLAALVRTDLIVQRMVGRRIRNEAVEKQLKHNRIVIEQAKRAARRRHGVVNGDDIEEMAPKLPGDEPLS
tara:strand:- start:160 stop:402 length:243 start_codon:yes stop_codon:yes gene_type:complete